MAYAGHVANVYVTSTDITPTSANLLPGRTQTDYTSSRDDIETNHQGDVEKSSIAGQKSRTVSLTVDYDPSDALAANVTLLETAHADDSVVYVTVDMTGTGAGRKNPMKVVGDIQISATPGSAVTATFTLRSQGAQSSVTIV